jgi:TPR repeat protein
MMNLPEIRFNGKAPSEMTEVERAEIAIRLVIRGKACEYGHTKIPQDMVLATSYYRQAADFDSPDGLFYLSKIYLKRFLAASDDRSYIREDIAVSAMSVFPPEKVRMPEVAFALGLLFEHAGLRALQNPASYIIDGSLYLSWASNNFYRGSLIPDVCSYDARAKCAKAHERLKAQGHGAQPG